MVIWIFVAWLFLSSFWYVCGIKNLCNEANWRHSFTEVTEQEVIDNNNQMQTKTKLATCSLYMKSNIGHNYQYNKNDIFKLQSFLKNHGYKINITNIFDNQTKKALEVFQKEYLSGNQIKLGQVDKSTLLKINQIVCKDAAKKVLNKK